MKVEGEWQCLEKKGVLDWGWVTAVESDQVALKRTSTNSPL
jgi:hypothetical protein